MTMERISILDWGWAWVGEDDNWKRISVLPWGWDENEKDQDMYRGDYFFDEQSNTGGKWPPDVPKEPVDLSTLGEQLTGGPSEYYDFPQGAITLNDLIEHKNMDFHRGNIFKACWRWGTKAGTTMEYDARKIIYSGCRLLMMLVGVAELRKTLQEILDDPQFKERDK